MRHQASFGRTGQVSKPARHGIHPALFYGMFTLLLAGNGLLGTALLLSSDIARLLNGQTDQVVEAYEDRIAQLRVEVDRLQSRSYAQAGDINLQLQELAQQQEVLLEQHQLVRALVDKADTLGIEAAALSRPAEPIVSAATAPSTGSTGNPDIGTTAAAVTRIAMTSIAQTAIARTDSIVDELGGLGIAVELPSPAEGVGGPLLPALEGGDAAPMIDDANAVMAALMRYKVARDSVDGAPIHMPISGNFRRSSSFGNRTDPFTRARAFHAGLDFAAPSGTAVYSAGSGIVTFVGTRAGYGKLVEITHGDGLLTRYGHLSAFLSHEGQRVLNGTPIAKVGSTGRSTGPHLHFEVRRNDTALDPKTFLDVGTRLLPFRQGA